MHPPTRTLCNWAAIMNERFKILGGANSFCYPNGRETRSTKVCTCGIELSKNRERWGRMTILKGLRTAVLYLGAFLLSSQVHAVSITDVSIQTSTGVFQNPSAAYLGQGKAKKAAINGLTGLFAGDPWTPLDKTNKASKTFNGVDFTLTADVRQKSGEWGLAWNDAALLQTMDFILVLKGGKKWGAYLFESGSLFSDAGGINGLFEMTLLNKRGKLAKLRRATIYGRVAALQDIPDDTPTGPGDGPTGPGDGPTGPGDGPTGPGDGPTGPGEGPTGPGDGPTGPGDGPTGPGDGPTGPDDPDVTEIPAPGSLALTLLGLGLGWRQFKRGNPHRRRDAS